MATTKAFLSAFRVQREFIRLKQKGVFTHYFAYTPSTKEKKEKQKVQLGSIWPVEFEKPFLEQSAVKRLKAEQPIEFRRRLGVPVKACSPDTAYYASALMEPQQAKALIHFRNVLMKKGNKEKADRIMADTFNLIKLKLAARKRKNPDTDDDVADPKTILVKAIENASPLMNLREKMVGGVKYTVPVGISESRSAFEGIRWIVNEAEDRPKPKKTRLFEKLADLLIDTANYNGKVIAQKHEHHRVAEQNRAYAHYAVVTQKKNSQKNVRRG